MVFDISKWQKDSLEILGSTLSGIYAMLLVCVYIAFSFTELVKYPDLNEYLEKQGFFVYLFLMCNVYFIYIMVCIRRAQRNPDVLIMVENDKSHGSISVRYGAIIFGIGTFTYFFIELLVFFEHKNDSPCRFQALGANTFLTLFFIFGQTYFIFMYPRLNLHSHKFLNRIGLMHVVAANIILWIRTLIKESLEEIEEYEFEEIEKMKLEKMEDNTSNQTQQCDFILERAIQMEKYKEKCNEPEHSEKFLPENILSLTSPYFFPFVIEFSLIGASVFYIMSNHVGVLPHISETDINNVHKPNPSNFVKKSNVHHSFKGTVAGLVIVLLAVINLILFFGLDGQMKDEAEYISKIANTIINFVGIFALIYGIAELNHLKTKENFDEINSDDLDIFLLKFTSFFNLIYMIFTIITGSFVDQKEDFPNELHIVNGVMEMIQVVLQLSFITSLKHKEYFVNSQEQQHPDGIMPGRQITVFLFLFNLAQWIVFTFEIQKVRASQVEEEFYGFMPWVLIQRITLPLAVFFRFHSAVVSIELWKEVYCEKNEQDQNHEIDMDTLPSNVRRPNQPAVYF